MARLVALGATALLLVAHSPTGDADGPSCENYAAFRVKYRVAGTCGPPGVIELVAMAGSCDLFTEGDDVGLPSVGTRERAPDGNIALGGFTLYDPQEPRGRSCTASLAGTDLDVFCRDSKDMTCLATLTPED